MPLSTSTPVRDLSSLRGSNPDLVTQANALFPTRLAGKEGNLEVPRWVVPMMKTVEPSGAVVHENSGQSPNAGLRAGTPGRTPGPDARRDGWPGIGGVGRYAAPHHGPVHSPFPAHSSPRRRGSRCVGLRGRP